MTSTKNKPFISDIEQMDEETKKAITYYATAFVNSKLAVSIGNKDKSMGSRIRQTKTRLKNGTVSFSSLLTLLIDNDIISGVTWNEGLKKQIEKK